MEASVERLKELLSEDPPSGEIVPVLAEEGYTPAAFSAGNYKALDASSGGAVAFVDGGNAELVSSSNFSLSFVRVFGVVYSGGKRARQVLQECTVLVRAEGSGKDVVYAAELFPGKGDPSLPVPDLRFDSMDETLRHGIRRSSVSSVAGVVRRLLELKLAASLGKGLGGEGLVVVDGNLQETYTHEGKYLAALRKLSCPVVGLSKTSTVFTTSGDSFNAVLMRESPSGAWWYHPVASRDSGEIPDICFAKFHAKSRYVFMVQSFSEMKQEWLSVLAGQSTDPVFLGYPYGLVHADRMARISNQEQSYLRTKIVHSLGKSQKELERYLNTVNAHDVLDGSGRFS